MVYDILQTADPRPQAEVSLRGVNCRFRSQLGCLGQKITLLAYSCCDVCFSVACTNFNFPTSIPVTFIWESPQVGMASCHH